MIELRWKCQPDKPTEYINFSGEKASVVVKGEKVLQYREGSYSWGDDYAEPAGKPVWSGTEWQDVPEIPA
jgi:hypothetical protein